MLQMHRVRCKFRSFKTLKVKQFINDLGLAYSIAHLLHSKLNDIDPSSSKSNDKIDSIISKLRDIRVTISKNEHKQSKESLAPERIVKLEALCLRQHTITTQLNEMKARKTFCNKFQKDIDIISLSEIAIILTNACEENKMSKKLKPLLFITHVFDTQYFLKHAKKLNPFEFKLLFKLLLTALYHNDARDSRNQ